MTRSGSDTIANAVESSNFVNSAALTTTGPARREAGVGAANPQTQAVSGCRANR
jgi:hypothetical protein